MPERANQFSPKQTIDFITAYNEGQANGAAPKPRDFLYALQHCAEPGTRSLLECELGGPFFEDFVPAFSKGEILEAIEISIQGARKELAAATLNQDWLRQSFAFCIEELIDREGRISPQLVGLTSEEFRKIDRRLEQLATESERKATELADGSLIRKPEDGANVILRLVQIAGILRACSVLLHQSSQGEDVREMSV